MNTENIKVIAFDADDTLWVNEPYFRESEAEFCKLLEPYMSAEEVNKLLFKIEIGNLSLYGYGVKSFMLSMIEVVDIVTKGEAPLHIVNECVRIGKEQLNRFPDKIDGVEEVLIKLSNKYRLVLATKGDLLDQQNKLKLSGLGKYFHHIEIMSDKQTANYSNVIHRLGIEPKELMMVGNSVKSDVLPVLELGGMAVHVPFHTTWDHEVVEEKVESDAFAEIEKIEDLLSII